ncbi:hypothetical protein [Oceanisphaera pacifica]|uniref:Uncharacterized protein n=1 Tax=Oceanisphaera pacifica TaxID=2818389 RepID=A0ABS3NGC7_9GAMM|nr:hypothetical protein [Oceanisphaera pacifica]MBO1519580.1 hypothetical protein [Oceanisphaera pacifica]
MKKILLAIVITLSFTVNAKSPTVFLQENPKAANTLQNPEKASLCMAANGIVLGATSNGAAKAKLNKLNAIIWAFLEDKGIADEVEHLLPVSTNKIKHSKSPGRLLDSAGCENLSESIIKTYIK